jgi:tetratricopeptide (TPR) repeat protein
MAAQDDATPLLLIDSAGERRQPLSALPHVLPVTIPAGVFIVYGCEPGATLPVAPLARVTVPHMGKEVVIDQTDLLRRWDCPDEWHNTLLVAAQGNMLALRLAWGLLRQQTISIHDLEPGLAALHKTWWEHLDAPGQRLALLLAAAGEPLPLELCRTLLDVDPQPYLAAWNQIGIAETADDATLAHSFTREYLAEQQGEALAHIHGELTQLGQTVLDGLDAPPDTDSLPPATASVGAYSARQFARHAALSPPDIRDSALPLVAQRAWVRAQERRTQALVDAAHDMAWELRGAASGPTLRLVRAAILTGTLVSLARTLLPEAAVAALGAAVEQHGREAGLKSVRALVDQLPDGQNKALILRQMGEACYGLKMRTSAMRLLSQALDIEEHKQPAAWRDQRDQLHTTLASAALDQDDADGALIIAKRISHTERRGMVQTQVMRWLLQRGELERARTLVSQIEHESLADWAQAEVAVTLARAGDNAAAAALLNAIDSDTARVWAETELACDLAASDEAAARQYIDSMSNPNYRDRGLAQLARALAEADKDGDALDAAGSIQDVAVRVAALLDLRLMLEGLVAMLALEQATAVIGKLPRDVRVPLVSMLAASYAALGRSDEALAVAERGAEGEERDRALSRVAVALAAHGEHGHGLSIARALDDEDERDWTLAELTHVLAEAGRWDAAQQLCSEISTDQQRARALADLAIARARAGDPLAALQIANQITLQRGEYARALLLLAPLLVAAGNADIALSLGQEQHLRTRCIPAHALDAAQVSRYRSTVATALAEHGNLPAARSLAATIPYPLDQARARVAIAQVAARSGNSAALTELGHALRGALHGRNDAFRLLEDTVPVLVALGGAALLRDVSAVLEEVDSW